MPPRAVMQIWRRDFAGANTYTIEYSYTFDKISKLLMSLSSLEWTNRVPEVRHIGNVPTTPQ